MRWKTFQKMLKRLGISGRLPCCAWCEETFHTIAKKEAHHCSVHRAVKDSEARAMRPLSYEEMRAVRDRARKELAMEQEGAD